MMEGGESYRQSESSVITASAKNSRLISGQLFWGSAEIGVTAGVGVGVAEVEALTPVCVTDKHTLCQARIRNQGFSQNNQAASLHSLLLAEKLSPSVPTQGQPPNSRPFLGKNKQPKRHLTFSLEQEHFCTHQGPFSALDHLLYGKAAEIHQMKVHIFRDPSNCLYCYSVPKKERYYKYMWSICV